MDKEEKDDIRGAINAVLKMNRDKFPKKTGIQQQD